MANVGMLGYIAVTRELSFTASIGNAGNYIPALSESMTVAIERYETKNIISGLYEPDDMDGVRNITGDITFAAVAGGPLTMFLTGALGQRSETNVSAAWHEWTITDRQSATGSHAFQQSIMIDVYRPGATNQATTIKYIGCCVDKLSMNIKPNQDLRCTVSLIAQNFEYKAIGTPTYANSPVQPFAFDTCSIQVNGAAVDHYDEFTVEIMNQLEGIPLLDSQKRVQRILPTGPTQIRVGGVVEFDNFTEFTRFANQTEFAMEMSFSRTASFSLLMDFPRLVFTEMPIVLSERGRVTASFSSIARTDPSSLSAMAAIVTMVGSS